MSRWDWEPEDKLPVYSPTCVTCRHLSPGGERVCAAFPEGIPEVIWMGDDDHRQPFPGDHGIQYARRETGQ